MQSTLCVGVFVCGCAAGQGGTCCCVLDKQCFFLKLFHVRVEKSYRLSLMLRWTVMRNSRPPYKVYEFTLNGGSPLPKHRYTDTP